MARRRMIDPGIWGSEDFNSLQYRERLLWIGLFSIADDHGKGRASPAYLRSAIFPFEDIDLATMDAAIDVVSKVMKIELYMVKEARYYRLTAWDSWQKVCHPTVSTIPDPIRESFSNDSGMVRESFSNDSGMVRESFSNDSGIILANEFKEFKEVKGALEPFSNDSRTFEIAAALADISARAGLSASKAVP